MEANEPRESGRAQAEEERIKENMASGTAEVWHEMTFNREPDVEEDYGCLFSGARRFTKRSVDSPARSKRSSVCLARPGSACL